jgi:hypothetical protein
MVVDFFLLERDLDRAAALLAEAKALCDEAVAGESGLHHVACATRHAWWMLERGEARPALALLEAMAAPEREQDRVDRAWIAAAAALALDDPARARDWLASAPPGADVPADFVALWLLQALRLARVEGRRDAALQERARALLQGAALRRARRTPAPGARLSPEASRCNADCNGVRRPWRAASSCPGRPQANARLPWAG